MEKHKCLIIGSGPAGYTAAIYTSRANLKPVLYEGIQPGGQLTITAEVENFPGYPAGINGLQMMEDLKQQAQRFGAEVRSGIVTACDLSKNPFRFTIDGQKELIADTVIICTGASAKYLGLPDEAKYSGKGVSACATCDGFFYRRKPVAIVGGGDSACEEALYLAGLASKVYLIVRKNHLRASQIMQDRVLNHPKIEVLFNTNTLGLFGEEFVEGAHLVRFKGEPNEEKFDVAIDGLFLAIGHRPNSEAFKHYLPVDADGYIKTEWGTTRTAIPGVFAAGDVADPRYQQAVVAAAMGCVAAKEVEHYLNNIKI
ncbi:MAG: thioredoxin-disulfide reductase [Candidatus Symbiothrix sp.]|jgi:thioredoxin reductase (NADPH)|nr:thioredoxin-disulfide reductase [Candidatus Symbiothrix sp.]